MESLRVAVCEDDIADRERLLALLNTDGISAASFSCGEDFLQDFKPGKYDLVLMDIYMKGVSGVDTVTRLREKDNEIPVAFITSSTDYALESYRLNALKYIEKPVSEKAVRELLRFARIKKKNVPSLCLRVRGKDIFVPFARIRYAEQQSHELVFYLTGGETLHITDRLDAIESCFAGQNFFRCHKSYLVNLAQVKALNRHLAVFSMKEGGNVYIRRESLGAARQAFEEYLFAAARGAGDE